MTKLKTLFALLGCLIAGEAAAGYTPFGDIHWKAPVASTGALPTSGNVTGDIRLELAAFGLYFWNGSAWVGTATGTVTNVALTMPGIFSVSGSPISTSGTFGVTLATETANTVWAGPTSGGAVAPTFRALVGADLPNPSAATLGGVQSIAAVSHKWINTISTSGVPNLTQPDFTDVSGTCLIAQGCTGQTTANAGFNALSPMTTLGDIIYGAASGVGTRLAGNTTSGKQFLTQTGTGAVSAAPVWGAIAAGDVPNLAASIITSGTLASARGGTNSDSSASSGIPHVSSGAWTYSSIVNADVSGSAGITYGKLSLTNSIVDGDIASGAAITRSKLATGTAHGAVVNDTSGNLSSVAPSTAGNVFMSNGTDFTSASLDGSRIYRNGTLAGTVSANAFTVTLKAQSGSDASASNPILIPFRSATAATGTYTVRSVTGALSVIVPDATTIGATATSAATVNVYALDNAGTVELAVSLSRFDEGSVQNTSAISGGSSASTLYSTTARTGVPIYFLGREVITLAASNHCSAAPTEIANGPTAPMMHAFTVNASGTSNGTGNWVAPNNVLNVPVCGHGGGGSGGSGPNNSTAASGGGGGGAATTCKNVSVVPGVSYTLTAGGGGVGPAGVNGVAGADGANGTDSTFGLLATFKGGHPGAGGGNRDQTAWNVMNYFGAPSGPGGHGGAGKSASPVANAGDGAQSAFAAGGSAGGVNNGGGGGAGDGAGAAGGAGGSSGAGSNGGTSDGAGGGGGGYSGAGNAGGSGGNGGGGSITVYWWE